MKKLFIAALLVASLTGFAQKSGADKALSKMTTELSLTAEQQTQLKPIIEEQMALQKDSKENPDNAEDNKAKGKEIGKKINAILTAEQKELRKTLKEQASKKAE
ncbi:hypothetical protein [Flavobacterium sp.]|uniref:hypothetical protein n=1 Tax=Flavobacterium sp. TaxID=239 RepID=UPI003C60C8F5